METPPALIEVRLTDRAGLSRSVVVAPGAFRAAWRVVNRSRLHGETVQAFAYRSR